MVVPLEPQATDGQESALTAGGELAAVSREVSDGQVRTTHRVTLKHTARTGAQSQRAPRSGSAYRNHKTTELTYVRKCGGGGDIGVPAALCKLHGAENPMELDGREVPGGA
jgi:hypothetical protein